MVQLVKIVFGLSAMVFIFTVIVLVFDGLSDDIVSSDVAIILGSKVNSDGSLSLRLKARLDTAVDLYRRGVFNNIIVSGGTGVEGFDEAVYMKRYVVAQSVPESVIIVDSNGVNTLATAKNASEIMRLRGFRSALIVSQYFHISRSRMALHKFSIKNVHSVHAKFFEWRDIYSTAREAIAIYGYLLE